MTKNPFNEEYTERTAYEDEILRCLVGSRAYGTVINNPPSDFDFKGIFIAPECEVLGIVREQETRRYSKDDHNYSIRHFARLATKCVPNVLELLFCEQDCVVLETDEGRELRDNRKLFLSKRCVAPYIGYAEGQLKKSALVPTNRGQGRQDIVAKYGYDCKFAMHTIRLLNSAFDLLRTGTLIVNRPEAPLLLDIRFGNAFKDYADFKAYAINLIEKIREEEDSSPLPDKPYVEQINDLIIEIQKKYWRRKSTTARLKT